MIPYDLILSSTPHKVLDVPGVARLSPKKLDVVLRCHRPLLVLDPETPTWKLICKLY
jgi:hypothetical protein